MRKCVNCGMIIKAIGSSIRMSTFHRVEVPVEIRAPIAVNILIVTVDSTVSGIFISKKRIDNA